VRHFKKKWAYSKTFSPEGLRENVSPGPVVAHDVAVKKKLEIKDRTNVIVKMF